MTKPRPSSAATTWLAASGILAGASVIGVGTAGTAANAEPARPSSCPAGTYLVATRVCELYLSNSTTWNAPSSVTSLQILAVGGGGGGGGGTTYAPGGGGGGGQVRVCTTSLVDLSHHITITEGAGGAGGADGANHLYDSSYGAEYGDAGSQGGATTVASSKSLCAANGGQGGEPGYHYLTASLPTTPIYGGGGNSGSGVLGGSAAGLEVGNLVATACISGPWEYNIVASGGAGAQAGNVPSGSVSGAGGNGSQVNNSTFPNFFEPLGGGGGGGGGYDCHGTTSSGTGGSGGGGAGGTDVRPAVVSGHSKISSHGVIITGATAGQANTGGGGGGGEGSYLSTQTSNYGVGVPGAGGGSGVVVIRFAEPAVTSDAYFATASSKLTAKDKAALTTFATTAIADNMATVKVEGFTDPRGSVPYNQALSTARANNTASFLRKLFSAAHASIAVTAAGKGEKHTYSNYALDRVATVSAQGGTVVNVD